MIQDNEEGGDRCFMEIIVCNIFLPWKDIDLVKNIGTREKCNRQDFDIPIIQILRINITRINIKSHNFHAVCKNFQLSGRRDDPKIVYGLPSR